MIYYRDDHITIYHGDCREIAPTLGRFDLLLTDPPYGINHSSSYGASWENTQIEGDSDTSVRDELLQIIEGVPAAVFGTWKTQPIADVRGVLVWDKGPAFGMGDLAFPWKPSWELIYIKGTGWEGRRDEGVLRGHLTVSWESKGRKHPHEKPVSLLTYLISKAPGTKTILDPFAGSGTTGRAAKDLGLHCTMIECEERYCEIAAKRMAQEVLF